MALTTYIERTRALLQNPAVGSGLIYNDATLTRSINWARGQIATREKCIRVFGVLTLNALQQQYVFGAINFGTPSITGVVGPNNVRRINISAGTGQLRVDGRPWEWFEQYHLNNAAPPTGRPTTWAQYAQGNGGSIFFDPIPDMSYACLCDLECAPIALSDDTTVEAIPFAWIDTVPFFAAYLTLLGAQTGAREKEAERMMERYNEFATAARKGATPGELGWQFEGAPDPIDLNRFTQKAG